MIDTAEHDRRQRQLEGNVAATAKTSDQATDQLQQIKRLLISIDAKASSIRAAAFVAAGCCAVLALIALTRLG